MSERVGLANCTQRQALFLGGPEAPRQRDCSEQTAREIDEEVKTLLDRGYAEAKHCLTTHRNQLERIAAELLAKETLDGAEFYQMAGRSRPSAKELTPALPDTKRVGLLHLAPSMGA